MNKILPTLFRYRNLSFGVARYSVIPERLPLLATTDEIIEWNARKASGPFASDGDFDNGNAGDAANQGEYNDMAAVFGTVWATTDHWAGPTVLDGTYIAASSSNDVPSSTLRQSKDMLGSSLKCLMDDRESSGSGDAEANAIITEILSYANTANLDYSDGTKWPKLSTGYYGDVNPLFNHCHWAHTLVLAYSNCASLVGANETIESWFSALAYLAENEIHADLADDFFPNRKTNDYTTGRWDGIAFDGDTSFDVWGEDSSGTDIQAMTSQRWYNNRRMDMAALVLVVGVLLDDTDLISEGERFLREWMGFGINVTTTSHGDYNRDISESLPQLGIIYHFSAWRRMMASVDAAYRKGYTTSATQTTSLGSTHATWGTAKTNKTLAECIGAIASWVDESLATQVYTPANASHNGVAGYRRHPKTLAGNMIYVDGWLVRAAAMFDRSDWRDAARRVGTPEGFGSSIQNDGGVTGSRIGMWDRFLDPWDFRDTLYGHVITPPSTSLLGVGSTSTSLVDYPKVSNVTTGDKYVDASVSSSGDGNSLENAYKTLQEGLAALSSGQTLVVKGGTYSAGTGITRSTSWAAETRIMAYGTDRPIIDGSGVPFDGRTLRFSGAVNELWHGFHVRNQTAGGTDGGQTVAFTDNAHDCTLSNFWVSHSLKDGIWGYNAYNLKFLDCAVWRLGDGFTTGTNAPDCYAITGDSNSGLQGIVYARCFAGNAGDDGFDFYRNQGALCVDCVSYEAGYYWNGTPSGDGNAFKMGSGETNTHSNSVIGSISIDAKANGFDDNGTDDNNTFLRNTAVNCGTTGFQVGSGLAATVRDNISIGNGLDYKEWAAINDTYNSWNVDDDAGGNPDFPLNLAEIGFSNTGLFDWSLGSWSKAIGAGVSGGNLGASDVALAIAKEWLAKDLT